MEIFYHFAVCNIGPKKLLLKLLPNCEITRYIFTIFICEQITFPMQDNNTQAGPKTACLEPVAHQQQSLYIIQNDKDCCNCIFFHLFLNHGKLCCLKSITTGVCHWMHGALLTLTITLSVSSFGRNTHTHRRSCIVLFLWKVSLLMFERLQPVDLCPSLELHPWVPPSHDGIR